MNDCLQSNTAFKTANLGFVIRHYLIPMFNLLKKAITHALLALVTLAIAPLLASPTATADDQTLEFSGYKWIVRPSGRGGPGPNEWNPSNVSLDSNGWLHLKLTQQNGQWHCAELHTEKRLGFGVYQFWIIGRVDKLDKNLVFGLYNYPTPDLGRDGTHEIDIEFSRWEYATAPIGNYTVWPARRGVHNSTKAFPIAFEGDESTQRFTWTSTSILFQSLQGHRDDNEHQLMSWLFQPQDSADRISQSPMPLYINLWCHGGKPPTDGREVEVIVKAFKFTPMQGGIARQKSKTQEKEVTALALIPGFL